MFGGTYSNTLDDKGRVAVPVKFRDALRAAGEERFVLTLSSVAGVRCFEAYTVQEWGEFAEGIEKAVREIPRAHYFDPEHQQVRLMQSALVGTAEVCVPDKQGRVSIPQILREMVPLEQEVFFLGIGPRFQIFGASAWRQMMDAFMSATGPQGNGAGNGSPS